MFDANSVLGVSDLKSRAQFARSALAVLGKPIRHSLSPTMQNAALKELAKSDKNFEAWAYYKFEVAPEDLHEALQKFHAANFLGINLTIPHKEVVLPFLEDISGFAKMVGAANTLIRTPTGWRGDNTDGFGICWAVENFLGRAFKNSDVVILGAGGAARAAAFKACAENCASLKIYNRTKSRLERLLSDIENCGFAASALEDFSPIKENSIIINASSVGLKPADAPLLDFNSLAKNCAYFDMPYIRGRETNSVIEARKRGFKAASGLGMLAAQGAMSLSLWTSKPMLTNTMLSALQTA